MGTTPILSSLQKLNKLRKPVTGGAGTLALVNARALLEHGLSGLALFDLNPSHAEEEIQALRADFPHARILTRKVNVTDADEVESAVEDTADDLGSVDILCCFAGVVGCQHAIDMTPKEWKRTLDINTTGAFFCAQAVARYKPLSPTPLSLPPCIRTLTKTPHRFLENKSPSPYPSQSSSSPPSPPTAQTTHSPNPPTMPPKPRSWPSSLRSQQSGQCMGSASIASARDTWTQS